MAPHYILPGVQLESKLAPVSFAPFLSDVPSTLPRCTLRICTCPPPIDTARFAVEHADFCVRRMPDGWLYQPSGVPGCALHASPDHRALTAYLPVAENVARLLPLLRTALECAAVSAGVLSLHSACVVYQGEGLCFTAPSGTGKSTRAASWQTALNAELLSGDRPSIRFENGTVTVCGAPWDGKERIFLNKSVPLRTVCSIRRGSTTGVRRLSPAQANRLLCQQCFLPMWDTETAALALGLIHKLCGVMPVYRVTCGPDEQAAKQLCDILFYHPESIMEAEQDMKIKPGFVLRELCGEHIVMPTGKNIAVFDGTIILNDVAAFVWQQLCEGCSREELIQAVVDEFDVDRLRAGTDLDALLDKLRGYQVLEETA